MRVNVSFQRSFNKKTEWRCQYRKGCSASVIQDDNMFHYGKSPHNHPGEDYIFQKSKLIRDVKNMVTVDENTPVDDIVNELLRTQDPSIPLECLPSRESLMRSANRLRQLSRQREQSLLVSSP